MPPIAGSHFWRNAGPTQNGNEYPPSVFTPIPGPANNSGHGIDSSQNALDRVARYPRFPYWDSLRYLQGRARANALHSRMLTARNEIQIILAATEDAIIRMGDLLVDEPDINMSDAMDLNDCHHELLGLEKDLIVWRRELVACEMFLEEQLEFLDLRDVYMG